MSLQMSSVFRNLATNVTYKCTIILLNTNEAPDEEDSQHISRRNIIKRKRIHAVYMYTFVSLNCHL